MAERHLRSGQDHHRQGAHRTPPRLPARTVLVQPYWTELRTGLEQRGIPVHHFVLHADRDTLTHRIATDTQPDSANAGQWRLNHLTPYEEALPRLREEAQVVDTTDLTPAQAARTVADAVGP